MFMLRFLRSHLDLDTSPHLPLSQSYAVTSRTWATQCDVCVGPARDQGWTRWRPMVLSKDVILLLWVSEYRSNNSSWPKPMGPLLMLHSFSIQKLKLSEGSEPPWFSPSYLWENPCISLQTRIDLGALLKDFHQFIILDHKTTPNTLNYQPERQPL